MNKNNKYLKHLWEIAKWLFDHWTVVLIVLGVAGTYVLTVVHEVNAFIIANLGSTILAMFLVIVSG